MALSLNTSHPLYANLKMLIGVDEGNTLVDLVTPGRTLTPDVTTPNASSFGTGAWGRHFRTGGASYNPRGAALSPAFNPGNNTGTLVFVTHGLYGGNNDGNFWYGSPASITAGNPMRIPSFVRQYGGNNLAAVIDESGNIKSVDTGVSATSTTDHMFTVTRNGETAHAVYVDGASIASGGLFGYNSTVAAQISITRLGGASGFGFFDAEIVWLAWFDIALTPTQVSDLYASLGANNAFGLVAAASGSASTAISATVANITGSVASKSSPKTAILATLANVTASVGHTTGTLKTTITATLSNVVGSITSVGSTTNGTFTSEVLKDYAGNVLASTALNFVRIYNDTTGALVLNKTGVSTNGSGIVTFSDAALVAGTTYRVDWETAAGSRRMPRKAAA